MDALPRPRIQRSVSERPALPRRSPSLFQLLERVPSFRNSWVAGDDDCSTAEDEPPPPPSPTISPEEAKRARKQKLQRLFKQGVSKVMKQRALEMDKMAKLASLYALDAFAGRLQHGMAAMSTKPWYIFAAFRLQISSAWLWCIITCSLAHSMLVFLEPGTGVNKTRGGGGGSGGGVFGENTLRGLEAIFITIYAIDVALKVAYMGMKNYLKKPWQKLMIVIVLMLAVDASGVFSVRFARFLRPAILSLRTRSIRRFYAVVSNMLPGFLRVCLPVLFFLLLSASFAALSFGRAKSDFEDSMTAGYSIWILMVCADNYETLVNEPSQHPAYIPFVVMVIIVGSMFLLSLLLGVTYDVFIEHTTDQVKTERLKEFRGLNTAFATMDPEGTGKLSLVVWDRFLHYMMPRTTRQERALYFEIASGFADELDVLGFMDLRQVLSYSFINVSAVERQGKRAKWEQKPRWLLHLLQSMEGALHLKWWKHTVATVVLIDCLFLPYGIPHQGPGMWILLLTSLCGFVLLVDQAFQFAEWIRHGSGLGPLRLPGKSFHIKVAGYAVVAHTAIVALLYCPPLRLLLCSGLSLASRTWASWWSAFWSQREGAGEFGLEDSGWCPVEDEPLQHVLAVGAGDGHLLWLREGGDVGGMCMETDWCTEWLLMLAYTMRLMRCWRLVTLNDTLLSHVETFFSVVPVFVQTLSFALIVAYAFAMGGMQIFADKASAFKDAGTSLKTTLQLFVGVDFSVVVEQTVAEVGRSAFLYFVAYHVVGVLIVFNLLTAIMIQLYGEALTEKSRQGVEEQRRADQELQDSLYEHNQKQRVLRLWGRNLTQRAAKLNLTRGTPGNTPGNTGREARRVLGAQKSSMPTVEELTKCQSYAKVDLLRALQDRTRGDNSLRTFERSLYQKLKSSKKETDSLNHQLFADGEMIYHRGEQHQCCYFVHKGVVRLEAADGTVETKETGEMFGEEALVASLPTCATAIAEGRVECVGIDRATFTEVYGTLENLGHIFLRLQRSGSLSLPEAPSSDMSSRRSMFSAGGQGSGRGFRTGGCRWGGDLDSGGYGESQSERWKYRRNLSLYHRSSRGGSYFEEWSATESVASGGSGAGGADSTPWRSRRSGSNTNERAERGERRSVRASGMSSRGDLFAPQRTKGMVHREGIGGSQDRDASTEAAVTGAPDSEEPVLTPTDPAPAGSQFDDVEMLDSKPPAPGLGMVPSGLSSGSVASDGAFSHEGRKTIAASGGNTDGGRESRVALTRESGCMRQLVERSVDLSDKDMEESACSSCRSESVRDIMSGKHSRASSFAPKEDEDEGGNNSSQPPPSKRPATAAAAAAAATTDDALATVVTLSPPNGASGEAVVTGSSSESQLAPRSAENASCPHHWRFPLVVRDPVGDREPRVERSFMHDTVGTDGGVTPGVSVDIDDDNKASEAFEPMLEGDVDSPELSPSAAPVDRKQPLFASGGYRTSLFRRDTGADGSGLSAWSTNSPQF